MKRELDLYREPLIQRPQPWRLSWLATAVVLTLLAILVHAVALVEELRALQYQLSEEERTRVELEKALNETKRLIPSDETRKRHQQEIESLRRRIEIRQRYLNTMANAQTQPPPSPALLLQEIAAARPSPQLWLQEIELICCQPRQRPHLVIVGSMRDDKTLSPFLHGLSDQSQLRGLAFPTTYVRLRPPEKGPLAGNRSGGSAASGPFELEFLLSTRMPEPRLEQRR